MFSPQQLWHRAYYYRDFLCGFLYVQNVFFFLLFEALYVLFVSCLISYFALTMGGYLMSYVDFVYRVKQHEVVSSKRVMYGISNLLVLPLFIGFLLFDLDS